MDHHVMQCDCGRVIHFPRYAYNGCTRVCFKCGLVWVLGLDPHARRPKWYGQTTGDQPRCPDVMTNGSHAVTFCVCGEEISWPVLFWVS